METLEGFMSAYGEGLARIDGTLSIYRKEIPGRVAVVTGGGSGHEPGWLEYIGDGFADAIVQGDVFAAPSPNRIVEAAKAVHRGKGILFVYANYAGDKLNFDLAADDLADEGIEVRSVRSCDDAAGAPLERRTDRRGIAGGFFTSKIAGAAVAAGYDLAAAAAVAERASRHTRSIAVASAGGTVPGSDVPTFILPEGKMEIGLGMHGEQGVRRGDMMSADDTVTHMLNLVLQDAAELQPKDVCILVNGLGATTRGELFIVYRKTAQLLAAAGLNVHHTIVGEVTTSQEMHGFSISIFALDDELKRLYDAPCRASFFSR
ncbi:dihydroxyacetone kinase subunit DhaK [Inquilinus sp. OTU3971]|uniref:dihydroxyacetone kinase subunit DhaK n=1 Tax=Inquilinus sp. OTU3971 TaxID=3043855 RepID=UPI00313DD19E